MLERTTHQAAGLLALTPRRSPRMMAVVNHGDERTELPLLWRLCLALVNCGYSVTVLDATTAETPTNPGLVQLLDDTRLLEEESVEASAWNVLAAAHGMQALCAAPHLRAQHLHQLGQLFRHDNVVILYSKVEWMIPLLGNSEVKPLLALSPLRTSVLTSYLALKRLLINGKLHPTIVNMVEEHDTCDSASQWSAVSSLDACAKNFLHYEVRAQRIATRSDDETGRDPVQQLALRLMESALDLDADYAAMGAHANRTHLHAVDHFAGSH